MKMFTRALFLLALGAMLMIAGCATLGPPQPPSLELPKPPADLRAVRKGDKVTLSWTIPSKTTDRQTVRSLGPTRICRGLAELMQCGTPVGEAAAQPAPTAARSAKQKIAGSYVDPIPGQMESDNPSGSVTYAVEALNTDGRGAGLSNQVRVPVVRTPAPPHDFNARVTGQGIVLTWTNELPLADPQQPIHYLYRVYRRPEGSQQSMLAGEVPAGSERGLTLTDSSIEWEKTYEYRVETVTVIAQQNKSDVVIEGDDSSEVKVFADDVFPPAVPSGMQAVFSGPGQKAFIDLIWAPVTDVDLEGYNVYRHEEGAAPVKVNTEVLKSPAYRDADVVAGRHYFYSVSTVDLRGNESARSEEAGEAVP